MGHLGRRAGAAAVAVAVAATAIVTTGSTPVAAGPPHAPASGGSATKTVTLITGDRLTLRGSSGVTIRRGEGRDRVPFSVNVVGGHVHAVPADALPLLRAGRLDPRLFDVTALVDFGYDDARRADVPVIVAAPPGPARARKVAVPDLRVTRDLPGVHGVAGQIGRAERPAVWRAIRAGGTGPEAPRIYLDGVRRVALDRSVPQIGAPAAWQAGYTGTGVKVAVVDSGIDGTHPDLAGQVIAHLTFVDGADDLDHVGHGTHVAATVAGTGAGRYKGVAPGAKLIDAKVCGSFDCPDSVVIAGMQWAVAEQGADVVNISLGSPDTPGTDPVEQAVQDLTAQYGALFVVAAGNSGADHSVQTPSSADAALAVGAVDGADALAPFSSRGPRDGDYALKPDLTAPGVDITAARSKDAELGRPGEQYVTLSGTSMATPHVAGAAAILAQRRPDWDAATLKAALMGSARPNPATGVFGQGAGRVDVPSAIAANITATPPSLSFGRQLWPHTDDQPTVRTVAYRNHGPEAVTLALAVHANGATPVGLFRLSADSVTVPAGGSAEVTVTADTRVGGPDGPLGAYLTATPTGAAGHPVSTPLAVDKEVESYDVAVNPINRAGKPTADYFAVLENLDGGPLITVDGGRARLPKGRYVLFSLIFDGDIADPTAPTKISFLLQPVVDVTAATTIRLDARTAKPTVVRLPHADAAQFNGDAMSTFTTKDGNGFIFEVQTTSFDTLFLAAIGGDVRLPGLVSRVEGRWARARPDGSVDDSPYQYDLAWITRDRALTGQTHTVRDSDLATVRSTFLSASQGGVGELDVDSRAPGIEFGGSTPIRFHTPATRTLYFGGSADVWWQHQFREYATDGSLLSDQLDFRSQYRPGGSYRDTWNQAVFGPGLPGGYDRDGFAWAARSGDQLFVNLRMFADGADHAGLSAAAGTMVLYRDGVQVGSVDLSNPFVVFDVPPGRARYRLEVTAERGAPFATSTRVDAAWEFLSDTPATSRPVPLDLSVVRFSPALDERNTAPAGCRFTVPVSVEAQVGSAGGENRSLLAEVSYDDGVTWRPAPVRWWNGGAALSLEHPGGSGFVSLRTTATDAAGNTVKQTIIRAYRYRASSGSAGNVWSCHSSRDASSG